MYMCIPAVVCHVCFIYKSCVSMQLLGYFCLENYSTLVCLREEVLCTCQVLKINSIYNCFSCSESKSIPLYMLNAGPHLVYLKVRGTARSCM